ncbi:MAG: transposase [Desulfobacterales bacterium]|nr:transposase [Desulfobacterales bacterium]
MARPLRISFEGAFYHVTSRGNERKAAFKSKRDREKSLEYLESTTERYTVVVHAFCLMDNHYHLLIETPAGNLPPDHAPHQRRSCQPPDQEKKSKRIENLKKPLRKLNTGLKIQYSRLDPNYSVYQLPLTGNPPQ